MREARPALKADISAASLVVAYLFREGCVVVQEKLQNELAKGTGVLSVGFEMRGWERLWDIRVHGVPAYFYRV